jgi:hypothetical protein
MGLSNEERIKRVLNSLVGMRYQFDPDNRRVWEDRDDHKITRHIDEIKESLDQLVGILIQQTDTTGAFWLFGENEDGFRGLTMEFFGAKDEELWKAVMDETVHRGEKDDLSLLEFAQRIGFSSRYNIMNLAHWWDMWSWIPSILYGMNRYEDTLFRPEFRRELNRLVAKMQQFRMQLLQDDDQAEQVLLLKYKLYFDDLFKDTRSCAERCDALRAMTQQELEDEVERRTLDKQKREQENREKHTDQHKFIDPEVGDITTTVDSLVQRVEALLSEKEPYRYARRIDILRVLELWDGSVEDAAEDLYKFLTIKHTHERRYGSEKVKICRMCRLTVLDQRNKTGHCKDCLKRVRKRGLLKKDKR